MNKQIPSEVVFGVAVVFVIAVLAAGMWLLNRPASQPPPATSANIAHGIPPPTSAPSPNWHGPMPTEVAGPPPSHR